MRHEQLDSAPKSTTGNRQYFYQGGMHTMATGAAWEKLRPLLIESKGPKQPC